jgi:hypothetical protein
MDDPDKREWLDMQLRLLAKKRQDQMHADARRLLSFNVLPSSQYKGIFDGWWVDESFRVPPRRQFSEARKHLDLSGADVSDRTLHDWIKIGRVRGIFRIKKK